MSRRQSTNLVDVIYEDQWLMVCRKPAGIATEGGSAGRQDMESLLRNRRAAQGERPRIFVIHRLDQPVEGLLVFGKDPETAAKLSKQVSGRTMSKKYLAAGVKRTAALIPKEGLLQDWLERIPGSNRSRVCGKDRGKKAELTYRVLAESENADEGKLLLFDIELRTGRHHQIRLQLAHLGCPLLGDRKYGGGAETELAGGGVETKSADGVVRRVPAVGNAETGSAGGSERFAISGAGAKTKLAGGGGQRPAVTAREKSPGLALCAYRLEFVHPVTGKRLDFVIKPEHPVLRELADKYSQFKSLTP